MANRNSPNDASAQNKPEGDRWESDSETVERYDETAGDESGGITNPERNQTPTEGSVRRTSKERDYTPRRYEQPAEDDPVMPSQDSSLDTKI